MGYNGMGYCVHKDIIEWDNFKANETARIG